MFGMGFTEILLVAIVAIIALGPEKLPQAMVDIAKFFRAFKKTIDDAKQSIDKEIYLSELKQEALSYKSSIQEGLTHVSEQLDLNKVLKEDTEVEQKDKISDVLKSLDDMSFSDTEKDEVIKKSENISDQNTQTPCVMIDSNPKLIGFGAKKETSAHEENKSV